MRELMKNAASSIVVEVCASGSIFWEAPKAIVWARNNNLGARHSVEQSTAIDTFTVGVDTGDLRGSRLHTYHTYFRVATSAHIRNGYSAFVNDEIYILV